MKIIVTGATGLIGRKLIYKLLLEGHSVFAFARNPSKLPELPPQNILIWSDNQTPDANTFKEIDAVIHLAGEGIADSLWTESRKQRLRDSRVNGTKKIVAAIGQLPEKLRPKSFISGSAIGYYADSPDAQDESSIAGHNFLSGLCKDWEDAAQECSKLNIRTVLLRTGIVLANDGGVLSKTGPIILGDGSQWMSWVHVDDVVNFILFALKNISLSGPYNLTSPNPVSNREFTNAFAKVKKIPVTIPAPKTFLQFALGEMSQVVLANQKIVPTRALQAGFQFKVSEVSAALDDLLKGKTLVENRFSAKQFIPASRQEIFEFFSKAENLETLTPPWLNFKIVQKSTPQIKKDTVIDYKLKIHGVPVKWKTLISEWSPESSFVDLQLKGPYRKWHHVHRFHDVAGGTLITDDVTFEIPGWLFGKLLLPFVLKDVHTIFSYRQSKIKELFFKNS